MSPDTPPAPLRKRIRRKPEDAEREILVAAEAFLQTNDFRDLAVDEVMSRTGMTRSAFYNYFPDRNALVVRLLERIEAQMMDALAPWLDQTGDPSQTLRAGLDQVVEIYARHGHVLRAIHEASYHDHEVERYYRHGVIEGFIDAIADALRREDRAGRASIDNPREVAYALLMMNANVMVDRFGRPPTDRPRDVSKTLWFIWERVIYGQTKPRKSRLRGDDKCPMGSGDG